MNLAENCPGTKTSPAARARVARRAGATVAAAAIAALWSSAALADQFVVVDSTWDHTPDLADSHYRVTPLPGTPSNWRKPVDYASGTAYVHLEVYTKPTATPTKFQACFEATPTYACVSQSPTYTAVGVIDWETKFSDFWSPAGETVDWTKGTSKIALILKDTQNNKPSADNVGATTAALYTPTKVRMVITIVAPGSTYVPPSAADAGAPMSDAGPDSTSSTSASVSASASTGAGAGAGGTSTGDTTGSQGSGGAASTGAGGAASSTGKTEGGCSVAPDLGTSRHTAWLSLAITVAGLLRLRRRDLARQTTSRPPVA